MSTRSATVTKRRSEPEENEGEIEAERESPSVPVPAEASAEGSAEAEAQQQHGSTDPTPSKRAKTNKVATKGEPLLHPFPAHLDPNNLSHFDHFFFQLLAFRVQHSNFNVHREQYPTLHAWLQVLKKEYKAFKHHEQHSSSSRNKSQLTQQQVDVLEFYHVPLTSRGDDHWMRFYQLLCQYRDRHGHCLVPRLAEVPGLGDWVTDQRRQAKLKTQGQQTSLTDERQHLLDQIGFAWQVRHRPEWDRRYEELVQYKDKHGDCKVPQHYKANRALGKWVAKQREQYRLKKNGEHSFLTDYRIEKLEQCGFAWQVRHSTLNSNHHTEDAVSNISDEAAVLATASQQQQYQSEQPQQQSMNEENDDAAEDYEASMQDAVLQEFGKDDHVHV